MNKISTATEGRAQRNKRMISEMSNAKTFFWVFVALIVHVVIILGTSRDYIRVHWFGGMPTEVASGEDAPAAPATPATAAQTPANPATPVTPAATGAKPAAQATANLSDDEKKMAERSNSPMVKSITDAAKPSELPKVNPLELNDKP